MERVAKKTDRYNSMGINIEERIENDRTFFFKDKKNAIEKAIYLRSYIDSCYQRKENKETGEITYDLVGWTVPK